MDLYLMLHALCAGCVGLFAGAMLTEGLVLVPFWRALPAPQFFVWYAENGKRLQNFFGPLTWLAGLTSLATALYTFFGDQQRWPALAAALLILLAVATFFAYFERANARFAAASLSEHELPLELSRWANWHMVRMVLSVAALACAIVALVVSH